MVVFISLSRISLPVLDTPIASKSTRVKERTTNRLTKPDYIVFNKSENDAAFEDESLTKELIKVEKDRGKPRKQASQP